MKPLARSPTAIPFNTSADYWFIPNVMIACVIVNHTQTSSARVCFGTCTLNMHKFTTDAFYLLVLLAICSSYRWARKCKIDFRPTPRTHKIVIKLMRYNLFARLARLPQKRAHACHNNSVRCVVALLRDRLVVRIEVSLYLTDAAQYWVTGHRKSAHQIGPTAWCSGLLGMSAPAPHIMYCLTRFRLTQRGKCGPGERNYYRISILSNR